MAKIQGPLMSLSASGTVAGQLTYRATRTGNVVQRPPVPTGAASDAQRAERLRFAGALHQWDILDSGIQDQWTAAGLAFGLPAYKLFTREYLLQQCSGASLPLIPSTTGVA